MACNIFKGLGTALVTPFKLDGSVDYDALQRINRLSIAEWSWLSVHISNNRRTSCLSIEEKQTIKNIVVDQCRGKVPILIGCGGNNTQAVVHELKTTDFKGVDAILSVCPYYNKPSQEGFISTF